MQPGCAVLLPLAAAQSSCPSTTWVWDSSAWPGASGSRTGTLKTTLTTKVAGALELCVVTSQAADTLLCPQQWRHSSVCHHWRKLRRVSSPHFFQGQVVGPWCDSGFPRDRAAHHVLCSQKASRQPSPPLPAVPARHCPLLSARGTSLQPSCDALQTVPGSPGLRALPTVR